MGRVRTSCSGATPSGRLQLQQYNELPVPRALKKLGLSFLRMLGKDEGWLYEWLLRGGVGQPVFWSGADAFTETQKKRLLSPRLRKKFADLTSWGALMPIREQFEQKAWEQSRLNWMTYMDLNLRLPELLLMRVDKMSMGVSLDGRVPFLRSQVCRVGDEHPRSGQDQRWRAETHPQQICAAAHSRRADRPQKAGFRIAGLRVVHG